MRSIDNIYNIISSKELSESVKSDILQNIMSYVDFKELTEGLNEDYRDRALTSSFRTLIESDMSESTLVSIGEGLMDTFSLEDISHSLDIIKCELVLEAFNIENNYLNEKNYAGYQIPFNTDNPNNNNQNNNNSNNNNQNNNKITNFKSKLKDEIKKGTDNKFLKDTFKENAKNRDKQIKDYEAKKAELSKEAILKQSELDKARKDLETLTKGFNKAKSETEKGRYAPLISDTEALITKLEKEHQTAKEKNASKINNYNKIIRSLEKRKSRESDLAGQYDTSLTGKIKKGLTLINKGVEPAIRKTQIDKIINRALQSDRRSQQQREHGITSLENVKKGNGQEQAGSQAKTQNNSNQTIIKAAENSKPEKEIKNQNQGDKSQTTINASKKSEPNEDRVYNAIKNLQNTFKDIEKNGYEEKSSKSRTYFVNSKKANEEIDKLELTDEQKNSLKTLIGDNLKEFTSKSEDELKSLLKNNQGARENNQGTKENNQGTKENNLKVENSKVENKTKKIEATPEDREKHLFMLLNNVKAEMGKEKGRRIPFETANNLFDTIYKDLSDKDSNFSVTPEEKEYFKKKFVNKDGLISFEDLNIEGLQNTVKDYLKTKNTEKKEEVKETPVKNTEKKEEVKKTPTLNTTKNNLEEIKKQDNPDQGDKIYNSLLKVLTQDGDDKAIESALGGRADSSLYTESIKKVRDQIKNMKEKDPNVSFEEGNENWDKLMTTFKDSIGANKDGVKKGGKKQNTSPKQTISEQPAPKSNFVKNTLKAMQGQNSKEYLEINKDSLAKELPRNLKDLRDKLTSEEDKKTVDDIIKQSLGRRLRGGLDKETFDTFKDDFELLNQGTPDADGRYQFNQETIDKWNGIEPDTNEKQNTEDNKAIMKASKIPTEKTPAEDEQKTSIENKKEKEEDVTPNGETSSKEEKISAEKVNQLSNVEKADLNNWQTKFNEGKNLSAPQMSKLKKLAKTNEEAKNLLDKFEERKNSSKEKEQEPVQGRLNLEPSVTGDSGNK